MTTFKAFTILTIFAFASCKAPADNDKNDKKENSQTGDTTQKFAANQPVQNAASTPTFVATLKRGIEEINATINDSTIFKARSGQLFVYENNSHSAWIADGRSAYIPPEQIVKVDTPYFKFNFSKWDFIKDKEYELTIAAKRNDIDLNSLIQKVRKKETDALKKFFYLQNISDGAAAEAFGYDFWALINLWTDDELAGFINSLKTPDKTAFSNLMLQSPVLTNVTEYYKLYYPKTLEKIKTP